MTAKKLSPQAIADRAFVDHLREFLGLDPLYTQSKGASGILEVADPATPMDGRKRSSRTS